MPYVFLVLALLVCAYLPQLWVRWVMHRHGRELPGMPGTGGELARHLLDRFAMDGYVVEKAPPRSDHYDPQAHAVRLSETNYSGKSLTAIAVAAHEVGHAIQHFRRERVFELRSRYIPKAAMLEKIGVFLLVAMPVLAFIVKAPAAIAALIGLSLAFQLAGALTFLIVLPEEWDASFNKALPILIEGGYLDDEHEPAVRSVLKAAAITYFAAALASMLNIGRWLLVLRR